MGFKKERNQIIYICLRFFRVFYRNMSILCSKSLQSVPTRSIATPLYRWDTSPLQVRYPPPSFLLGFPNNCWHPVEALVSIWSQRSQSQRSPAIIWKPLLRSLRLRSLRSYGNQALECLSRSHTTQRCRLVLEARGSKPPYRPSIGSLSKHRT